MIPNRKQWSKWSLPSKYSFIGVALSIAGLVVTIAGLPPIIRMFTPYQKQDPAHGKPNDPFTPILRDARSELRSNIQCVDSYRFQITTKTNWPLCRQTHSNIDRLFQDKFFVLGKNVYGEDNSLIWQWKEIDKTIELFNKASDIRELEDIESKQSFSFRDLYFTQAFLLWYTGEYAHECLGERFTVFDQNPSTYTGVSEKEWIQWPARTTVDYEKHRVVDFGEWLGLLD